MTDPNTASASMGSIFPSIVGSFERGCLQASKAISAFTGVPIHINTSEVGFKKHERRDLNQLESTFYNVLLVVDFYGAIVGKVCLLGTADELELISTKGRNSVMPGKDDKKDFWMEFANILSASIIDEVTESTNLKIYLDTPLVIENKPIKTNPIIFDHFFDLLDDTFLAYARLSANAGSSFNPLLLLVVDKPPSMTTLI